MSESTVKSLISEIKSNLTQQNSSRKDEVRVMQSMLSDDSYEVGIYGKDGQESSYCPAADFKAMCASVMSRAAKITTAEATELMKDFVPNKTEAGIMVDLSKEFMNTYLQTTRKVHFGGREKLNVSMTLTDVPKSEKSFPRKIGVDDSGNNVYAKTPVTIPAHQTVKVTASCPDWLKK